MHTNTAETGNLTLSIAPVKMGFILKVSIVAALGGLLFGFDTAIISGAIPYITIYFSLTGFSLGWAVGSILIGCGAGALSAGVLADKYGRRSVLIICAVLFALSGIGAGLSHSLWVFVFYRLMGGLGVGAAAMVSPMYISEIAPSQWRGRLVSLYQLAIVTGILLAYFSNYLLAGTGINNWRYMFMSQTIPALVFLAMLFIVPETPRWLVKNNRMADALCIINKTTDNETAELELQQIVKSFKQSSSSTGFSKQYMPILYIGIFIAVFQQITGINAILYYAPLIFKETGVGTATSLLQTIGIGLINVITTFIAIGFVDKVGRKRFLLAGSFLMALSLIAVAICFWQHYFKYYLVLVAVLVYVASFGCTLGAVTWVYLSEIFPNRIRAFGMSIATLALWLADFVVTYTFPILSGKLGISLTLLTYAFFCISALVYIWIKIPETKGRSLEEIEKLIIKKI